MKKLCALVALMGLSPIVGASSIYPSTLRSDSVASHKEVIVNEAPSVATGTVRFSGRIVEGTCVVSSFTLRCGDVVPPIRSEQPTEAGSVVTLTYL